MSDNKNIDNPCEGEQYDTGGSNILASSTEMSSVAESVKAKKTPTRVSSSSERLIKFERAQKCLENAALVSKRIKEHRKATAELLGRPFEEDDVGDTASEMASTMSERTGYSVATDTSTALSVQDALNIPGISESLANTLKQKELLMERIKQYKEIGKRPIKSSTLIKKESTMSSKVDIKKPDNSDVMQLTSTIKEKENALSVMQVRIKAMETTILELQEKINEKDQIIEAKNMATTLMSDTLSKKEKDSLALLEDTKHQMSKMQENFIIMEEEWRQEKEKLLKEMEYKDEKIHSLEESNKILENSRLEITLRHSNLEGELKLRNDEIKRLEETIISLSEMNSETASLKEKSDYEEEKGSLEIAGMVELTKKIELLEQLNCQIRQTNKELENKLASVNVESKASTGGSPSKRGSPLPTRKGGRNTAGKLKSPWTQLSSESLPQETDKKLKQNEITRLEMLVQSLNKDILDKEYIISQKEALILDLEMANKESKSNSSVVLVDKSIATDDFKETVQKEVKKTENPLPTVEQLSTYDTMTTQEMEDKLRAAEKQISELNDEIDAANKNMIKVKSNHKLKLKQFQKTIDNFSKVSDTNAEIVRLNEELHQLSQKVAELEEEKGNLQLHLVDYDSGRLTDSDVYKKMVEMETLADTRLRAISLLETQKFDLVQELHILQQKYNEIEDKLADITQLQNEQVCSEIKSVQLEEQIDKLVSSKNELKLVVENLKLDKEQLNRRISLLQEEKDEILHKLENYIQENMDLTEKLEKLSAEKVSSAESIEIVESLTTQEKLELEEYNKGLIEDKVDGHQPDNLTSTHEKHMEGLLEETEDLNKKIEMFTQEREEVMDKMSKINLENEQLLEKIADLNRECSLLQNNIDNLRQEKSELSSLNNDLKQQIEDLKHERIEIVKEAADVTKPSSEDVIGVPVDSQTDDKTAEKVTSRTKSVKQLTKEILKLKNIIKEREDEIADSQMKILALEEEQQKQKELLQNNAASENRIKSLYEENNKLKEEVKISKPSQELQQRLLQFQQANELLQQEIQKIHQEYAASVTARDNRINELENVLLEYEKQILGYSSNLQQKDKELSEYINQITKLNDVSQKLKSTIEMLEEEKAKDQNAEFVKSLNKQIVSYQKKIHDNEDKVRILEDEKSQLLSIKSALENKSISLELELKKLQDAWSDKQSVFDELLVFKNKYSEEKSDFVRQTKERDEEIHEIKLQLRKESIENEKLRNNLTEKEEEIQNLKHSLDITSEKLNVVLGEHNSCVEQFTVLETKNNELIEKLKKYAITLKKKTLMSAEFETALHETQKQLEDKNLHLEQLVIQVETLPALREKLKYAEEEINRLQSQKLSLDQQKSGDIDNLRTGIKAVEEKLYVATQEIAQLSNINYTLQLEKDKLRDDNSHLKIHLDGLNKKLAEYEIEQKNIANLTTKIGGLESDINAKQNQITELSQRIEIQEQNFNQTQFGYEAKLQERDLYIESLESEISKYKNRICRLEESISVMEDSRHSLERKADQLGNQLQEKQKSYTDYNIQEDELINRLAVLMDHDRVLEKQLNEIEFENKDLQNKIQMLNDENQKLKKSLSDIQNHCNTLVDKASRADTAEVTLTKYQSQIHELESHLKKITQEHQNLLMLRKQEIEEIESEFNTQIENSIKDKKVLSEKYEKVIEHVSHLENKLHEYRDTINNLNQNAEELSKINQELVEKSTNKEKVISPDYTEQYINEINSLNALLNSRNQENEELNNKITVLLTQNSSVKTDLESKISELDKQLQHRLIESNNLVKELQYVKDENTEIKNKLSLKEEQIKDLKNNKMLTFEMNIPKTEGMVISSTIEALNEESKHVDFSDLESQIVSNINEPVTLIQTEVKKTAEQLQTQTGVSISQNVEPEIVAKKAYQCYKTDEDTVPDTDPFNSDEGWGLEESEQLEDVIPGLSNLQNQIAQLKEENEVLRRDLETMNSKFLKTLKKLKELKSTNEMLSNELKISKQISQSSFLDSAIEDELRIKIQELENKLEERNTDVNKERREKESLKKQNEVFNNANDRLTDLKEKLENEIELWKHKFKVANDKALTLQWGSESKESLTQENHEIKNTDEDALQKEIVKIEKENEELQSIVEKLTGQNKELSLQQTQLKNEISNLNKQLELQMSENGEKQSMNDELIKLHEKNIEKTKHEEVLAHRIRDLEVMLNESVESNKTQTKIFQENQDLRNKCSDLQEEIQTLKLLNEETNSKMSSLIFDLDGIQRRLSNLKAALGAEEESSDTIEDLIHDVEEYIFNLKDCLASANNDVVQLREEIQKLERQCQDYRSHTGVLNVKIDQLNKENSNLLSTVAELRSSLSSAVDQRGFEIAELWKQHLAQREADFQNLESELRDQLNEAESKYEQLLDSVQFSSQEETNKLIMAEQVNSLQNKLQDREEHLRNLQDKHCEVMTQLDLLRSEMQDEKITHDNRLLEQQEEYEKIIADLTQKNKCISEEYNDSCTEMRSELDIVKSEKERLLQQIADINKNNTDYDFKLLDLTNQLRVKESEIFQKTHDYSISLAQRNDEFENVRKQLLDYEKKVEDLNFEKESELAILRLKIHEKDTRYESLQKDLELEKGNIIEELNNKIIECTNLSKQILELNKTLEDHSVNATQMQTALENQEIEILNLKDEITNLESVIRASSSKIQKHVSFASDTKPGQDGEKTESTLNKELLDLVPRAELDLALYMLHQRDVRCEELTMELTQLLEERDTLQLRLSDSLRSNEELKSHYKTASLDEPLESCQETVSDLPSFSVEKERQFVDIHRGPSSRSSSISDPDGDKPKLQAKLSELRSVKHSRDYRLRQESEQRQLDLRLLQRDVANLPPEAVEQLTQAHHTLSRDSQSTSTVLLNWLRGKSTPKVVHM